MTTTLFRFSTAEGLVHLLGGTHSNNTSTAGAAAPLPNLEINCVLGTHTLNGFSPTPSPLVTRPLVDFDHLVCDFDETITDHDTTSSFDTLANQIRPEGYANPQMSWSEILQAYLDDLEKVDVSDLCHLNAHFPDAKEKDQGQGQEQGQNTQKPHHSIQPPSLQHHLLDPHIRDLKCHIDGRTFTPEPELPVPKLPSLQPWIHSQVRKRAVEKVSLDRVYESGNLVGLTREQIREYGRQNIRLRPGMVKFLKRFVEEQDRKEQQKNASTEENVGTRGSKRGELWILSVNWSQDLIRGAMDQIFGSEEATERYLPPSHLISSNLQFLHEDHHDLQRRRKSSVGDINTCDRDENKAEEKNGTDKKDLSERTTGDKDDSDPKSSSIKRSGSDASDHLSCGKVKVHCLTGTDKLHAFQKIQREYAAKHEVAPTEIKWAYLGDSSTDLGCLVEADVGIIIGKSKSLLTECERSGIQVIDMVEPEQQEGSAA